LYRAFLDIDRRVKAIAQDDPICQLLMSAPGVGYIAGTRSSTWCGPFLPGGRRIPVRTSLPWGHGDSS
jgi:hypothetical protein